MSKRAHGEGSVRPQGKGYVASIMVTIDGERHRVNRAGKTPGEAVRRRTEAVDALRRGESVKDSRVLFSDYFETWRDGPLRSGRKQSTVDQYAGLVRVHALPLWTSTQVAKIRPSAIEGLFLDLEPCLSASSRRSLYAALRSLFAAAERDRIVGTNPVEKVARPKAAKAQPRALAPDQVRALIEAAGDHRLAVTVGIVAGTGLRRGELLGLRWEDLDLDGGELHVRRSLSRASDGLVERAPKSESGIRTIPLAPAVVALFKRHRKAQAAEQLAVPHWQDPGLVFTSEIGSAMEPRNWSDWYASVARQAGVSDRGAHALRHYAATAMLASGATVRDVADVLGHSSPVVTLEIYARAVPEAQRAAVLAASAVLSS